MYIIIESRVGMFTDKLQNGAQTAEKVCMQTHVMPE